MQKVKKCSKCGNTKPLVDFYRNIRSIDGFASECKMCSILRVANFRKTKNGFSCTIYSTQRKSSNKRNNSMPNYTLNEFRNWLFNTTKFELLYNNWVDNGYCTNLCPSVDRKDDYKPYTLDNIQLMTWDENKRKGHRDRKNGINNKVSKAVVGINKQTSSVIEFYSIKEAGRRTGLSQGNISQCCLGKTYKSVGGYKWKFKTKTK